MYPMVLKIHFNIVYLKILSFDLNLMMEIHVLSSGKLNRGLSVIDSYELLKEGKELSKEEIFLACALGWCIEWVNKYILMLL